MKSRSYENNKSKSILNVFIVCSCLDPFSFLSHWAIPEKKQTGRLRIWNFQGCQRNSMWNFQGLLSKTKWNFQGMTKKKSYEEVPGVLVFGLGISKGCNNVLWNFQG